MTTVAGQGTILRTDPDRCLITFERRLPAQIERVWAALTVPAELAGWLADSSVDLRVGGRIVHAFDPEDAASRVTGTILTLNPPKTLEYEWRFVGETRSILRYDLRAAGDSTLLTLTHQLLGVEQAAGYGAGWHAYLDALEAALVGTPTDHWATDLARRLPAYKAALEA
jgi:uncharacterized protein YndB with AHSA1/START domain